MKSIIKGAILLLILFFQQALCFSQNDSVDIWANALKDCKSQKEALATNSRIKNYLPKCNDQLLIANTTYFLKIAAKSNSPKYIFYDLFYIFENESQKRKLEKEFNLTVLKMETDPDFSNNDVKYQLYYFYSQFYYHLKDYYYAAKYANLFLKNGKNAFPENMQSNIKANSLTTVALIERNKNNIDTAIKQFRAILELTKLNKNAAWEGITSGNLAYTLSLDNRLQEAIPYYKKDDELSVKSNELGSALNTKISLGELYFKLNKPDTAFQYIDSANKLLTTLLIADKTANNSYLAEQQDIFSFLGNYYNQTGDFKKSSNYFAKALLLKDSVQRIERKSHLQQIAQNIEVDKNVNAINELRLEIKDKKHYLTFVIIVVIAVACILILLSFFLLRLLSKNKKLEEQNEIINQQRVELEEINTENYKLFSIISHDVRGPAASVHRLLQLLGRKKPNLEDFEKLLPSMLANSTNLNTTIESLLTWSKTQFNGIETQPETVEVKSFIDKIIPLFQEQANAKSIVIQNDCIAQHILIDKNQFEIIIRNTISNAIKFSHPDSVIRFNLKDTGTNIQLSLIDKGVGMTEEQLDNIINKNTLKTTTGTTGEKGVGLGLKLVKEFTEKNAGILKIESIPGVGTSLIFTFPKVEG
jgi:signal transduction histidine kinase